MKTAAVADQMFTIPDVMARLRVSRATVYRLIADGELKRHDMGRGTRATKTRISESELKRFIDSREQ